MHSSACALYRLYLGVADGMSMDVPVLKMTTPPRWSRYFGYSLVRKMCRPMCGLRRARVDTRIDKRTDAHVLQPVTQKADSTGARMCGTAAHSTVHLAQAPQPGARRRYCGLGLKALPTRVWSRRRCRSIGDAGPSAMPVSSPSRVTQWLAGRRAAKEVAALHGGGTTGRACPGLATASTRAPALASTSAPTETKAPRYGLVRIDMLIYMCADTRIGMRTDTCIDR